MAFRRRRMPFRRRRRRSSETYTLVECRQPVNVWRDSTCSDPIIDVFEIFGMHMTKGLGDTTEVASGGDKFVVVDGISFQSEHMSDPGTDVGGSNTDTTQPFDVAFLLTIWEGIVVLPYAQAAQIPAYLPNFVSAGVGNSRDLADRVLWKRMQHMALWGINVPAGNSFPQLEVTGRFEHDKNVRVKSKVRLDDRHGLYYVRNFVHDVFLNIAPGDAAACTGIVQNEGQKCIVNDSWWKIFYHTRK